jgi:hypothetical protein
MEQMMAQLLAELRTNRAEMKAGYEEMTAKLEARDERMTACLGKTEATDLEASPEDKESEAEHEKVPTDAAVKPFGTKKKRHRDRHLAVG